MTNEWKVRKRDGTIVDFDVKRIENAIRKAYEEVTKEKGDKFAEDITRQVLFAIGASIQDGAVDPTLDVEWIQDKVENALMNSDRNDVAKAYIRYRYQRELERTKKPYDEILEMLSGESEYWNDQNSNQDIRTLNTQREYIAGIMDTDIARRHIFDKRAVKAHDEGLIHIHDMDYMAENTSTNCCLLNLKDMLENGTVVNGVMIERPHTFLTAATIASQIVAGVSGSQFGGITITLTHLAPFVRDTKDRMTEQYKDWFVNDMQLERFVKMEVARNIRDGVQTLMYQLNSFCLARSQTPFVSVCMYLGETEEYKEELAMVIEEVLRQRIIGMKNEKGEYFTIAFPKLLYILEEDNIHEDSKYWYLTQLAAECTAKRMVPDYISEKVMKREKVAPNGKGYCYPCINTLCLLTVMSVE